IRVLPAEPRRPGGKVLCGALAVGRIIGSADGLAHGRQVAGRPLAATPHMAKWSSFSLRRGTIPLNLHAATAIMSPIRSMLRVEHAGDGDVRQRSLGT